LLTPAETGEATGEVPQTNEVATETEPVINKETEAAAEGGEETSPAEVVEVEAIPAADVTPANVEMAELGLGEPVVTVSQSEPVYAEREALEDPHAFPTPAIAPSQARVRIAGRRLPLRDPTPAAVDILIDELALRATQAHAMSSPDREVAGVLLGPPPEKQPDGRYVVHVIDSIIAKHTVMHGASVTYTPESWRYMNDKLAERYPDETVVMVGWYHTHPGFGIFLSGMDQFIHQNFFTQIWHIALVLDPLAKKSGLFCWNREQTHVNRYDFGWPAWASGSW
jgi:proteasome lid subunit RPN8/RPN11